MPRFLFWNVGHSVNLHLIARAAVFHEADILILAECDFEPGRLLESLNEPSPDYQFAPGNCKALVFFTRFDSNFLTPMYENSRVSIRRLRLPGRKELTVVGAHLPSKMHFSAESQSFSCTELNRLVEEAEENVGHQRTVILADLNVNPFESGVVAGGGLHAVTTRELALKGQRTIQEKSYRFFYNPMWSHFGDRQNGPPGTYYYDKAEYLTYFWNIFDQVLLRPGLLDGFKADGLRILTNSGNRSLLNLHGKPDKTEVSDHLPILLELDF